MPCWVCRTFGEGDHPQIDIGIDQAFFFRGQNIADQLSVRRVDLGILDDLVKTEHDPGEGSPLFEDIRAAARLENQINKL